jgi:16S rRNA (adenine1518-N6/adenine1519-N6)-dimethyltransferase
MNLLEETKMLLKQYNLKANKRLGQNFMISENIINEIVDKSEITEQDIVLEIGPGLGSLTKELISRAKKVIAIELDENMVELLKNRFTNDNFELIHGDVLKIDLKKIINNNKVKVVANLPYYITTPIIMKLLEERLEIVSITVMVQKEVGERLCAEPGSKEYGAITVSVNYYCNSNIIINVPKQNFMPEPEVDSCVIKLDILEKPPVDIKDEKTFFDLIKAGFSQRRKTINNSFTSGGFSKEIINDVLNKLNIDSKLRAENLSIYDFANISNNITV